MIELTCPRCGLAAPELIECESCKIIGCVRCITKQGLQWICGKCKLEPGKRYVRVKTTLTTQRPRREEYVEIKEEEEQSAESALAAMFG
jgi:hypothetical protein